MKIIYAGIRKEAYHSKDIYSFEYNNFYLSLKAMANIEVIEYPFDRILEVGREKFNQELLDLVIREKPDLFFAFMYTDELDFLTLEKIKKHTVSLAWFSDDHWRFHNYSRRYAPVFSFVSTTYSKAVDWFKAQGSNNVLRSQWAANINLYKPLSDSSKKNIDVGFVGGWNYPRGEIMKELKKRGILVQEYGSGWERGRVSHEEMISIFARSKINLALNPAQGLWNKNSLGRILFRRSLDKIVPDFHLISNLQSFFRRGIQQIKARHFEIPACGGFLLTTAADDLATYFKIGKEIVLYEGMDDFIEKIHYYLQHEEEREQIAKAGYERVIQEHTYEKRFQELFRKMGLYGK